MNINLQRLIVKSLEFHGRWFRTFPMRRQSRDILVQVRDDQNCVLERQFWWKDQTEWGQRSDKQKPARGPI